MAALRNAAATLPPRIRACVPSGSRCGAPAPAGGCATFGGRAPPEGPLRWARFVICGITGFFAPGTPVAPWFAAAAEVARHRGPDGDGVWAAGWPEAMSLASLARDAVPSGGSAALGFVRLSILDLGPTGRQPMVEPGRAAIAFNGEIYNYVELREELRAKGWTFTSTGDSEVLLKGWLEWREDLFARLNGMWAIAIYDAELDGIVLSRDRFGEKPLFWTPWSGGVAFASEVKQLREFPGIDIRLDRARAAGYLTT